MSIKIQLGDEQATVSFGGGLAQALKGGATVFMTGTLGAGKTTTTRGILQGLGHKGAVKSPTYTLVEPYALNGYDIFHFDLYRLGDPEELEYIGIREYFSDRSICIVEWPARGLGYLPEEDIEVVLSVVGHARQAEVIPKSPRGEEIIKTLRLLAD